LPKIEALKKDLASAGARWRFIGHLQTNKAKQAVRAIDAIDAVDSLRLLKALAKDVKNLDRTNIQCLVEVNVSGEAQKFGLKPEEVEAFLGSASEIPQIELKGLMAMAPYSASPDKTSRPVFQRTRELLETANQRNWYRAPLPDLSMGMSMDYPIAVEEGATMVRIGTALYADPNR